MKREHSRSRCRLCTQISEIVRTLQPHPQCRTRAHNRSRIELFNAARSLEQLLACSTLRVRVDPNLAGRIGIMLPQKSTVALFALQTLNSP